MMKTKKMLKRVADLVSEGRSNPDISRTLSEEFKQDISPNTVSRMIKRQSIIRKQIVSADKEFKQVYKETLFKILSKANKNLDIIEDMRDILLSKLKELKEDIPESKLIKFAREINVTAKTLNDCIKSLNDILRRMETETSEVKIDQIQAVQDTIKVLKNLEECGYIEIKNGLYKSEMYKEVMIDEKLE